MCIEKNNDSRSHTYTNGSEMSTIKQYYFYGGGMMIVVVLDYSGLLAVFQVPHQQNDGLEDVQNKNFKDKMSSE
jgi:hypothetical protein